MLVFLSDRLPLVVTGPLTEAAAAADFFDDVVLFELEPFACFDVDDLIFDFPPLFPVIEQADESTALVEFLPWDLRPDAGAEQLAAEASSERLPDFEPAECDLPPEFPPVCDASLLVVILLPAPTTSSETDPVLFGASWAGSDFLVDVPLDGETVSVAELLC